ncbi:mechanosensitive ion channel family protein [Thermodesulfatator autotrophicus]|uniref:Mechanosensitive ion channel protein MscS n=1 Tax=Thermodesulfatator autotrophicus TaxID=1795632 RepID=A0A177E4T2_9BACT|nr:mechanosensitive ion channel family protein [Thermodesulfatator autotrophicus]OAG26973.1 mechanosensitive ion channel protein MscS [Thermodesulfatator autotrophicus]
MNEAVKAWWLKLTSHAWLGPLAIVCLYLIIAKIVDLTFKRILRRLTQKTSFSFDDELLHFVHWPVVLNIALLGPLHAIYEIGPGGRTEFITTSLIKSLIVLIWIITAFRIVRWVTRRKSYFAERFGHLGADMLVLLKNVAYVIIFLTGTLILLSLWQINITPLLASAGIVGVAVALAARETLSNFFGGISLFLDRTYKVGDYIILDSGERGEVIDVGIRSTRIRTRDDIIITIPNSIMANSKIINESAPEPRFRLRLPVGVAYGSDLEKVEKVLLDLVKDTPHVEKFPEPRIRYRNFGDSSINLELLCWVDDPRHKGPVTHELIKRIHEHFEKEGITIPFPQRDVHLYPVDSSNN